MIFKAKLENNYLKFIKDNFNAGEEIDKIDQNYIDSLFTSFL
jgi:ribosome assembly protein YihI (activator of Der GTPase)